VSWCLSNEIGRHISCALGDFRTVSEPIEYLMRYWEGAQNLGLTVSPRVVMEYSYIGDLTSRADG
jgi:hypothetical protein